MRNQELLIELYPRLFHMTHVGSWPGIQRLGLLSTTALLDLFEIKGGARERLEAHPRRAFEEVVHKVHGRALLRDQIPLNAKKLSRALDDGLTTEDWCRLLNRKVFFWGPKDRLKILQDASAYRGDRQTIIEIDCARLLERHGTKIRLCHMNSGATQPMAFRRGLSTFLPIEEYPLEERRKKYGRKGAVAEITVDYAVPDVAPLVVDVYEIGGGLPTRRLV